MNTKTVRFGLNFRFGTFAAWGFHLDAQNRGFGGRSYFFRASDQVDAEATVLSKFRFFQTSRCDGVECLRSGLDLGLSLYLLFTQNCAFRKLWIRWIRFRASFFLRAGFSFCLRLAFRLPLRLVRWSCEDPFWFHLITQIMSQVSRRTRNFDSESTVKTVGYIPPLHPTLTQHKRYRTGMFILLADCWGFVEVKVSASQKNPPICQGGSVWIRTMPGFSGVFLALVANQQISSHLMVRL